MKTSLLLIDIQNDYFDGGTMTLVNADKASENAKLILENFRKLSLPVIHIRHIATKPDATFFLPDTYGSEIYKNVLPIKNEKVIIKHYPNSFRETELLEFLKETGITDLVICGMMTHMCVDATVRAAKDLGFNCTLIGDACATKELEFNGEKVKAIDVHNAFLAALKSSYATTISTNDYLR
jgi:nicotinamidase-related amidase